MNQETGLFCPQCGGRNKAEARYCKYCGGKLRPRAPAARRMGISVVVVALALVLVAGIFIVQLFRAAPLGELAPLVPADANLMAGIQVARIVDDPDLSVIAETLDLVDIERRWGIDLRDFPEAVLFGDVSRFDDYYGLIAKGAFHKGELVRAIAFDLGAKFTPTEYKGYTVYVYYYEEGPAKPGEITFLADEKFAFGSSNAVKDLIDVKEGKEARISDKVLHLYANLGDRLIKVALEPRLTVKRESKEEFPTSIAPVIDDIEVIGFAFGKDGKSLAISAKIDFASIDSARKAASIINDGINKVVDGEKWREVRAMLGRVKAVTRDFGVTMTFNLSIEQVEYLKELDLDLEGLIIDIVTLGAD